MWRKVSKKSEDVFQQIDSKFRFNGVYCAKEITT